MALLQLNNRIFKNFQKPQRFSFHHPKCNYTSNLANPGHKLHLKNQNFLAPAVYSVFDTDYQILKNDLKRLFPEKFLEGNRRYVNVCEFKEGVDVYGSFKGYHINNIFPNSRPSGISIPDRKIDFLCKDFCQEFMKFFIKKNAKGLEMCGVNYSDISLISSSKTTANLILSENLTIKIQTNTPLLSLQTPEFHPLLTYDINVPIRFKTKLPKDKYKTVIIHSNDLQKNNFEILADYEEFLYEPYKLMKNVGIICLEKNENFKNSSPIYLSQILHNRIQRNEKLIVEPFYRKRKWKVFSKVGIDAEKVQLKLLSYNVLNSNLGRLGASGGNFKPSPATTSQNKIGQPPGELSRQEAGESEKYEKYKIKAGEGMDEIEGESFQSTTSFLKNSINGSKPSISGWPHLHNQPEIEFMYRKQILYDEVLTYNPDLIAYQEGETRAIPTKFKEIVNYNSVSGQADLILAYNPEKMELIEQTTKTFHSLASQKESSKLGSTNHRFLVAYFTTKGRKVDNCKPFIAVTTHLYWKDLEIKSTQLEILLRELNKLTEAQNIPIILLGDFNMDLSNNINFKTISKSNSNFKLAKNNCPSGTKYTTKLKNGFEARLDWMLYKDCWHVGYLENVSDGEVVRGGCMPSRMFPSDHVAQGFIVEI